MVPTPEITRLREATRRAGLSVQELAFAAGLSRKTVHAAALGQKRPKPSTAHRLARVLNVDVGVLFPELGPGGV
jgi:transcriptional regulator with XRE-family HTH domain